MSRIGPTGEAPRSNDPHDAGGLTARLLVEPDGIIKLEFGTSLTFLRMSRVEAEAFAMHLLTLVKNLPPGAVTLKDALDESVRLQSHYAKLLNMYDGGQRMQFESAADWINRLEKLALEKQ